VVEHKDVVLARLGASAGTGALVLVFLGILITTLQSYPSDTAARVLLGYRIVASTVGFVFLAGVVSSLAAVWWLVGSQPGWTYPATYVAFVVQIAALLPVVGWVLLALVWDKG